MSAADFTTGGYTLEVAPGSTEFTTYTQGAIKLKDVAADKQPTSPVTETYKVTIKKNTEAISTKNVNVTVAGKIAQYVATFVAQDLETPKTDLYIGNAYGAVPANADKAVLVLMGLDNKGNMFNVPLNGFDIDFDQTVGGATLAGQVQSGAYIVAATTADTGASLVVEENTFKIYKDGTLVTQTSIECSNIAPETEIFVGLYADGETPVDLEAGFAAQSGAAISFATDANYGNKKVVKIGTGTPAQVTIFAIDQYGNFQDIDIAEIGGKSFGAIGGNLPASFSGKTVTLEIESDGLVQDIDVYVAAQ